MKVVILAGGRGTRISEESIVRPKPMVEIGGEPILWHIMKIYAHYGFDEFIICAGYKQHMIKDYFNKYALYHSDITFDFQSKENFEVYQNYAEPWRVTVVDTGYDTQTGKRIKMVEPYIGRERFMLTYGDGVSDINITKLLEFHKSHRRTCTLTATKPESRFGFLALSGNEVKSFREKSQSDVGYINSGFMVMEPKVFEYLGEDVMLESDPMVNLTRNGEVMAYKHDGFWQCMDTLRDKMRLENLWNTGNAPWKVW